MHSVYNVFKIEQRLSFKDMSKYQDQSWVNLWIRFTLHPALRRDSMCATFSFRTFHNYFKGHSNFKGPLSEEIFYLRCHVYGLLSKHFFNTN